MNSAIGQSFPRDDIIKRGPALYKTAKLGVQHECQLRLRGCVAPFRLEVYSVVSRVGKVYSLENVKRVKSCGPCDQNVSLKIQFSGSLCLYFTFLCEREANEWMEAIQMHSLATPKHVTSTNLKCHVVLMPNGNCHLNGHYTLDVTDDAIRISDATDTTPRIVWPVHTIRFYGYRGKLFSVATASCSETGEGIFHLDALSAKEAEFIYDRVAALVSRMLKVAAVAFCSVPPSPTAPHLPVSVPMVSSSSALSSGSVAGSCNNGESSSTSASSSSGSSSTSPDDKKAFLLNNFYLKLRGTSIKKQTKAPEIYGLSRPRCELLEAFTQKPLERSTCSAILYGPLNCGKRLLVEATAVHLRATVLCIPAKYLLQLDREPDAGIELLFDVARARAPSIILIRHLEDILPSSSLSAAEADVACCVLRKVEDAFRAKKMRGVGFVGTISDLSEVNLPLPSFRWMDPKIYVPPPCLEMRRQVFTKELQDLLNSTEGASYLSLLAQSTAGFDFIQLMDLYRDVRKVAVSDAMDGESGDGRCRMRIEDLRKVNQVLKENTSERHRVYEESGLSSARYYAKSQEPALFVVKLMPNEALPGVSHCFLRISDSSVELLYLDPVQTIVSWQLTTIRTHTWTPLSFVLEIGRKSETVAGEFHFETIASKAIYEALKKTIQTKKIALDSAR